MFLLSINTVFTLCAWCNSGHRKNGKIFVFQPLFSQLSITYAKHLRWSIYREERFQYHSLGGFSAGQMGPVLESCSEMREEPPYQETDENEEEKEAGAPLFSSRMCPQWPEDLPLVCISKSVPLTTAASLQGIFRIQTLTHSIIGYHRSC